MSREFYDSPSGAYQPDYSQAQWGDVIYGPNGQPMRPNGPDYNIDPGIYANSGNFNGDPGIYARANFNGDNGMLVYPSQRQLGVDNATYQQLLYDAQDCNRGYDPRNNPNYGSQYERANYSYGPSVRLNLGPVQLNLGNGRGSWGNGYDNYNNYPNSWNRGNNYSQYGEPTYRDRYGRPYQADNYGWGNGSQWGRDPYQDQYRQQYRDPYRDQYAYNNGRYDGYNAPWNDNYRGQQMQRMAMALILQMLQRQRQGQWGNYDRYNYDQYGRDPYGRDQYGRYDQYGRNDPYGRDQYGQYDQYGRDPYGRDQYGRVYRDPYGYNRDRYGEDRSWQQGRDQYGRPYDLDQYGWGPQYRRDQYGGNGRDQYGRYGQYDRYGRYDQYGRNDQYDRYGRGNEYWNCLAGNIQQMLGHSVREFDPRVDERLGCATFVSAALRNTLRVNIRDTSCQGLENTLRRTGFQQVDLRDLRPGDVIIGNRYNNQPGHAAIYAGNGQVAQNTSGKRCITVESANVFNSRSFQRVVAYRPRMS